VGCWLVAGSFRPRLGGEVSLVEAESVLEFESESESLEPLLSASVASVGPSL
jgi:hypothetical protein